jgi:hypothetical protein
MRTFRRQLVSPALVVAVLALGVAMAGSAPAGSSTTLSPPANAFATYVTGPVSVPLARTSLAHLSLPKGKFLLSAKAFFKNISPGNGESTINCQLQSGSNVDEAEVQLQPPNNPTETEGTLNLQVATGVPAAGGGVDLNCEDGGPGSGTGLTNASFLTISAVQVASLTRQ